ncbi:MAG: hypothetical protein P8184_20980 [Calditrichia bacterium]
MKNLLYFFLLAVLPAGILLAGSKKTEEVPLQKLFSAPDTVTVSGKKLVLEAYLWRDFMPVSPPGGKPLQAAVYVKTADGDSLPSGLQIKKIWIVKGEEAWSAAPETAGNRKPPAQSDRLESKVRGGPKWEPGSAVTVVVKFRDAAGGEYFLKAADLIIRRTD